MSCPSSPGDVLWIWECHFGFLCPVAHAQKNTGTWDKVTGRDRGIWAPVSGNLDSSKFVYC